MQLKDCLAKFNGHAGEATIPLSSPGAMFDSARQSVATALAVRFAPEREVPGSQVPAGELPVKRYVLNSKLTSISDDDPISKYVAWLGKVFRASLLPRTVELAWIRLCERGVSDSESLAKTRALDALTSYLSNNVAARRPARATAIDWQAAFSDAFYEFNLRFLGSNQENYAYPLQLWCRNYLDSRSFTDGISNITASIATEVQKHSSLESIQASLTDILVASIAGTTYPDKASFRQVVVNDLPRIKRRLLQYADRDRWTSIGCLVSFLSLVTYRRWQQVKLPYYQWPLGTASQLAHQDYPTEVVNSIQYLEGNSYSSKSLAKLKYLRTLELQKAPSTQSDFPPYTDEVCKLLIRVAKPIPSDAPEPPEPPEADPQEEFVRDILSNQIPPSSVFADAVPDFEEILRAHAAGHWGDCQYRERWPAEPLTNVEIIRLDKYVLQGQAGTDIAQSMVEKSEAPNLNTAKSRVSQCLKKAIHKLRCCLITNVENAAGLSMPISQVAQRLLAKELPAGGLLGIAYPLEQVSEYCNQDPIAIAYHFHAITLGALAKRYHQQHRSAEEVQAHLAMHWVEVVLPKLQLRDRRDEES